MIVVALVALAALAALAAAGRSNHADQNLARANANLAAARARAAALGIPPGHYEGTRWVEDLPPTEAQDHGAARGGGPPGLLLRREPEIRGLQDDALATYATLTKQWLLAGNLPTEAWWTSFVQAQSEILLRVTRRTGRTDGLSDQQVMALYSWLSRLRSAGMPLTSAEGSLFLNVTEDMEYRRAHAEAQRPGTDPYAEIRRAVQAAHPEAQIEGDDEHSDYALERDRRGAILRDEAEALEEEGLRRTR